MSNFEESNSMGAVAIISMNGRFPGAKNIEEFWQNLYNGVESVKFFTREQLIEQGIDEYLLDNPKFVAADAILDDMDKFDAGFFDYSARDAEIMDPQHRMFLECAWEAMESAGYNSDLYDGKVAVYAGSALSGYMIRNLYSNPGLVENVGTFKIMIANSQDFLSTKVSYKMNLTGPSVNVNTLCSSSLVAVDMACKNLLSYGCDLAIAGGVSFQISRNESFFYQEGGIGSSDGHCRAYDSKANGTTSGSGLALVVLKRLEDAIADGDYIHGAIIGSAVNNDGASKNSFTAPNADGQAECIAEAIAMSGVNPETITYIEGHGTGTNLGDPIEISGLTKAFRSYTDKKQFCAVGSVKTNIGHLVTAGGVASLIKTVLSMQNKMLPPSLNFEEPNPKIDFMNTPFYVNNRLSKWEPDGFPMRAGVSSFGIGGTNAHVIVEEAPEMEPSGESNRPKQLVVMSAKTSTALDKMTSNMIEYIRKNPEADLADIAFTLHVGRRSFNHRRMVVCSDVSELAAKLEAGEAHTLFQKPKEQPTVFVFSSEENMYKNMGLEIYQSEPAFAEYVDQCADILKSLISLDIRQVLYPEQSNEAWAEQQLKQYNIARAAAFVTQYALAKLWMEWEVSPEFMVGEGAGEYVAACLSGVMSLEDALMLVSAKDEILPQKAAAVSFNAVEIPFISCFTGTWISDSDAGSSDYWARRQRQGVRFAEGLQEVLKDADQIFVEIGYGKKLSSEIVKLGRQDVNYTIVSTMTDSETLLLSAGQFWMAGGRINWFKFYAAEKRHRIPLPTYPFERQSYWIEPGNRGAGVAEGADGKLGLKKRPRPEMEIPYIAPRNETEEAIATVWQNILGFDRIGIHDDFFELGGHSLLAAAVAAELSKALQIQVPIRNLFELSTIEKVAEMIETYRWAAQSMDEVAAVAEEDLEGGTI
ncbi:MAG: phosphopantetheine-binding protein [Clostridia bacterium]|nr:phosphopantetheine-binding protein [Clostridia bacterium]